MMPIIKRCRRPDGDYSFYNEDGDIDTCDLQALPLGTEEMRYWYARGSHEGCGEAFLKINGEWFCHGMSHCSCYGPMEHFEYYEGKKGYNSIADMVRDWDKLRMAEVITLIEDGEITEAK